MEKMDNLKKVIIIFCNQCNEVYSEDAGIIDCSRNPCNSVVILNKIEKGELVEIKELTTLERSICRMCSIKNGTSKSSYDCDNVNRKCSIIELIENKYFKNNQ